MSLPGRIGSFSDTSPVLLMMHLQDKLFSPFNVKHYYEDFSF